MKCPECSKETQGANHNNRGVRCTFCWVILPLSKPEPVPEPPDPKPESELPKSEPEMLEPEPELSKPEPLPASTPKRRRKLTK
jgi:hypothetical protein